MNPDKVAVNIPKDLYELVKKRVEESGGEFKDTEEYVTFILTEIVKDEDETEEQKYSKKDEEQIKQRLKSLGYM
jgi:hypothetical protein